jgi:predicted XRE-type DNA-binding protein
MNQISQIIATIKRQLKLQALTYRDVAVALDLSEPSVKRLFASEQFTLDRIVEICSLLGFARSVPGRKPSWCRIRSCCSSPSAR